MSDQQNRNMIPAMTALRPEQACSPRGRAATHAIDLLWQDGEEVLYGMAAEPFEDVGNWYEDFSQTTEQEVQLLLKEAYQKVLDR